MLVAVVVVLASLSRAEDYYEKADELRDDHYQYYKYTDADTPATAAADVEEAGPMWWRANDGGTPSTVRTLNPQEIIDVKDALKILMRNRQVDELFATTDPEAARTTELLTSWLTIPNHVILDMLNNLEATETDYMVLPTRSSTVSKPTRDSEIAPIEPTISKPFSKQAIEPQRSSPMVLETEDLDINTTQIPRDNDEEKRDSLAETEEDTMPDIGFDLLREEGATRITRTSADQMPGMSSEPPDDERAAATRTSWGVISTEEFTLRQNYIGRIIPDIRRLDEPDLEITAPEDVPDLEITAPEDVPDLEIIAPEEPKKPSKTTPKTKSKTKSANSTISKKAPKKQKTPISFTYSSTTTKSRRRKTITTSTTPTTPLMVDIPRLIELITNLTMEYSANLNERVNKTLLDVAMWTCPTGTTTTEGPATIPTTTLDPYGNLTGTIMGKCFVCGLEETHMPRHAQCADAFAGDFLPLVPVDATARKRLANYRKYCRWMNVPKYIINSTDPRSMWGRWTGGCSVRWIDVSGIYTQRTCRNRHRAVTGNHWVSKRMAKLEMSLQRIDNGCIISPMASLVPLSRGVSIYARFHACVCTGSWCNRASPSPHSILRVVITLLMLFIL